MSVDNIPTNTAYNVFANTDYNVWVGLSGIIEIDEIIYEYGARRYYFTLTGTADGTTDVEIPISSIQCRRRWNEPTYLSVVIPGLDYVSDISDRPNGDMVIEMSYFFDNEDNFRTEIARATFNSPPRIDGGGTNQSITLTGYKTETWVKKEITLSASASYKSISAKGKITNRMPEPDINLNPGDTVTIGDDTYEVGNISITIGSMTQSMEVAEA